MAKTRTITEYDSLIQQFNIHIQAEKDRLKEAGMTEAAINADSQIKELTEFYAALQTDIQRVKDSIAYQRTPSVVYDRLNSTYLGGLENRFNTLENLIAITKKAVDLKVQIATQLNDIARVEKALQDDNTIRLDAKKLERTKQRLMSLNNKDIRSLINEANLNKEDSESISEIHRVLEQSGDIIEDALDAADINLVDEYEDPEDDLDKSNLEDNTRIASLKSKVTAALKDLAGIETAIEAGTIDQNKTTLKDLKEELQNLQRTEGKELLENENDINELLEITKQFIDETKKTNAELSDAVKDSEKENDDLAKDVAVEKEKAAAETEEVNEDEKLGEKTMPNENIINSIKTRAATLKTTYDNTIYDATKAGHPQYFEEINKAVAELAKEDADVDTLSQAIEDNFNNIEKAMAVEAKNNLLGRIKQFYETLEANTNNEAIREAKKNRPQMENLKTEILATTELTDNQYKQYKDQLRQEAVNLDAEAKKHVKAKPDNITNLQKKYQDSAKQLETFYSKNITLAASKSSNTNPISVYIDKLNSIKTDISIAQHDSLAESHSTLLEDMKKHIDQHAKRTLIDVAKKALTDLEAKYGKDALAEARKTQSQLDKSIAELEKPDLLTSNYESQKTKINKEFQDLTAATQEEARKALSQDIQNLYNELTGKYGEDIFNDVKLVNLEYVRINNFAKRLDNKSNNFDDWITDKKQLEKDKDDLRSAMKIAALKDLKDEITKIENNLKAKYPTTYDKTAVKAELEKFINQVDATDNFVELKKQLTGEKWEEKVFAQAKEALLADIEKVRKEAGKYGDKIVEAANSSPEAEKISEVETKLKNGDKDIEQLSKDFKDESTKYLDAIKAKEKAIVTPAPTKGKPLTNFHFKAMHKDITQEHKYQAKIKFLQNKIHIAPAHAGERSGLDELRTLKDSHGNIYKKNKYIHSCDKMQENLVNYIASLDEKIKIDAADDPKERAKLREAKKEAQNYIAELQEIKKQIAKLPSKQTQIVKLGVEAQYADTEEEAKKIVDDFLGKAKSGGVQAVNGVSVGSNASLDAIDIKNQKYRVNIYETAFKAVTDPQKGAENFTLNSATITQPTQNGEYATKLYLDEQGKAKLDLFFESDPKIEGKVSIQGKFFKQSTTIPGYKSIEWAADFIQGHTADSRATQPLKLVLTGLPEQAREAVVLYAVYKGMSLHIDSKLGISISAEEMAKKVQLLTDEMHKKQTSATRPAAHVGIGIKQEREVDVTNRPAITRKP